MTEPDISNDVIPSGRDVRGWAIVGAAASDDPLPDEPAALVDSWALMATNRERGTGWDEAYHTILDEIRSIAYWYNPKTGESGFDMGPSRDDSARSTEDGARMVLLQLLSDIKNPYAPNPSGAPESIF